MARHFEFDFNTAVKCYSRSAAGQSVVGSDGVRDLKTLEKTVEYLFSEVVQKSRTTFLATYDFVFDRLRAVRQDLTVQGLLIEYSGKKTLTVIRLLECCIRFYIYSQYRLSSQSIHTFSRHINESHLTECINLLLNLYLETIKIDPDAALTTNWFQTEALHILLTENANGLYRALQLPQIAKSQCVIKCAIEISTSLWLGNFVRAHRRAAELPLILQLAYRIQFAKYRPLLLKIYDKSYRSAQGGKFPLEILSKHLMFDSVSDTSDYCKELGLLVDTNTNSVLFKTGVSVKLDDTPKPQFICDSYIRQELNNVCIANLLYGKSI